MLKQTLYTARIMARGGRRGSIENSNGSLRLNLSAPAGMGGQDGPGTNPEELFAAGYAACFGGAVQYAAGQKKMDTGDVLVESQVGIGPSANKQGFEVSVALEVTLPRLSQEDAEALVAEAHKICPYSNATRGNVDVKLTAHGGF